VRGTRGSYLQGRDRVSSAEPEHFNRDAPLATGGHKNGIGRFVSLSHLVDRRHGGRFSRFVTTRPAFLPRVEPVTATFPIPHVDCVVGPGRVDGDHVVPAVAVWAAELGAGLERGPPSMTRTIARIRDIVGQNYEIIAVRVGCRIACRR